MKRFSIIVSIVGLLTACQSGLAMERNSKDVSSEASKSSESSQPLTNQQKDAEIARLESWLAQHEAEWQRKDAEIAQLKSELAQLEAENTQRDLESLDEQQAEELQSAELCVSRAIVSTIRNLFVVLFMTCMSHVSNNSN